MLGEDVASLELDSRGVVGDRSWSIRTAAAKIGSGKNTRRFAAVPRLLELRAASGPAGVRVTFPDGLTYAVEAPELADRLLHHCGQPLTLAKETDVSHFDDGPVSLIGMSSVDAVSSARGEPVDASRFRANIVLDTSDPFIEEKWIGSQLRLGDAVLEVTMGSPRCVMVDMATAEMPAQPGNLTTIGRLNEARLGVIARVVTPGRISVGDRVT
jgi:uncharacterized protein